MKKRVGQTNNNGFTIIESVLFLAITSLLFLIVFSGISSRNNYVRFTQAMRGLESNIQREQNLVTTGATPNAASLSCGSPPCIVLGRVMEFTPGSSDVVVHTITGNLYAPPVANKNLAVTLLDSQPTTDLVGVNKETFSINWGARFVSAKTTIDGGAYSSSTDKRLFGYIRRPNGTEFFPIGLSAAPTPTDAVTALDNDCNYNFSCGTGSTIEQDFNAELCFADDYNQYATINLGLGESQEAVEIEFKGNASCA